MADDPSSTSPTPDTPPPRTTGGGFRWEPPTADELQAMMPGYTIEKILGRGGMGAVYKGVQTNLDRTVAIKILPPGVEKEDPSFAERFKNEAKLMAKLMSPTVVGVFDFGLNSGGQLYIAMEYVDGTDVAQMIATQKKLPPDHALAITAHVCDALTAAHELGIVHRDIKPANVLINMKGQVKVADFGLAKIEEPGSHGLTKTGYAMGTPDFVAPEALMLGTAIDGRADVYAVGVMLYQMLTGNIPRGAFKPASVLVPGLDRRYDPIIQKAMQHDREERHQSAAELRRELDVILTVPLVQQEASTGQSAIPAAQVAQVPAQRSAAQKPVGKPPQQSKGSAETPLRPSTPGGAAVKPKEAGKSAHAPLAPTKSNTPLFAGLGIAAVLGIGAFVMFSGGKKTPPAAVGDSAPPAKPASVASSTPKPAAIKPSPAAASSSSTIASATQSAPFVNSLGMKFVPVPIRGGPTANQRVLFGVWDVRVQDYGVYAAANPKVDSAWKTQNQGGVPAGREPDHPVEGVNWEDAQSFCQWLTEKEITEGKLPKGMKYRLPSDEEWSWAVGLPPEVGATPAEKNEKNTVDFPWGKDYPPTKQAGNYADETFHAKIPKDNGKEPAWIKDYNDGYATTSPVGSFPANAHGLYDMGGNVWQWCEDWFDKDQKHRVVRGGSWGSSSRGGLLSSGRRHTTPTERTHFGFRCVVSAPLAATVASTAPAPSVPASSDKFPPGQWVKLFTKAEDLPKEMLKADSGVKFEDGWIKGKGRKMLPLPTGVTKNIGVRARFVREKTIGEANGGGTSGITIRSNGPQRYQLKMLDSAIQLIRFEGNVTHPLFERSAPMPLVAGREYQIEFAAIGERLIGRSGDSFMGIGTDSVIKEGASYISGTDQVRDIEVINLDGLSEAEALKILGVDEKGNDLRKPGVAASSSPSLPNSKSSPTASSGPKFPPGQWVKVFTKAEDLPDHLRKPDSGLKSEDGWLRFERESKGRAQIDLPNASQFKRNYAVRLHCLRSIPIGMHNAIVIRRQAGNEHHYQFSVHQGTTLACNRRSGQDYSPLFSVRNALVRPGTEYALEFGAVGDWIVGRYADEAVYLAKDSVFKEGGAYISGSDDIRDIEVINLDGLSEAEALKILGVDEKGNDLRAAAVAQEKLAMEQAKVVDAMTAIPELKVLHEQFAKLTAERVTAPFEADVAKLNAGYVGGIDRKITEEKAAGHLDGIIALEAEKKLLADQQPIPADDAEGTTANLKALRAIYRAAYAKIEAARVANLKQLTDPLTLRLKQLEADLTKKDRVPDAKTVREYREGLGRADGPPSAAAPPQTALGGPSALPAASKSATPLKKFPPGDDRKAAEWVLDLGGSVNIRDANGDQFIQAKGSLPNRPFDLVIVGLAAPDRAKRQVIEYTGLLPLAGLRKLSNVALSGLPIADEDTEILASLPELNRLQLSSAKGFTGKNLALLKGTTKITWMNLGGIGLSPAGLEQISQITNLNGLQLSDTYIEDNDLALLRSLKKLTWLNLSGTKVTPEGWKQLKGLRLTELAGLHTSGNAGEWCSAMAGLFPDVNKLEYSAREAVTPEDVAAVAAFSELSTLILATTYMDDGTIGALAGLTKLEILTLRAGSAGPVKSVTDSSMDSLLGLKKLEKLRLEKIDSLTPAALTKLTRLKSLKTLEIVTCQQFDDAAIAAFKKERPDVTVTK